MSCFNAIRIFCFCLFLFLFSAPTYGQINEIEPNGTPLSVQLVNLPVLIQGNAGSDSDDNQLKVTTSVSDKEIPINDLFKFTLTKKTNIEILLKILNQSADIGLIVIDNDLKNVVAFSNRVFSESEFIFKELEAGSYYIGIISLNGVTDYTLEAKEVQVIDNKPHIQEFEPNGLNPQEITLPVVIEGVLDINDFAGSSVLFKNDYRDVKDLYVFNLEAQKNLVISLENTDFQSSLGIVLYDSFKKVVEISQNKITRGLDPGLYYVGVFSGSGGSGYSLSIEDVPLPSKNSPKNEKEPNDTPEQAQVITPPTTVNCTASINDLRGTRATFDNGDKVLFSDYFKFVVLKPSTVEADLKINSNTNDADLELALFDKSGIRILEISDNSGSASEKITKTLEPGLYFISVGVFSGSASYNLSVSTSDLNVDETLITDSNEPQIALYGNDTLILLPGLNHYEMTVSASTNNFRAKSRCKVGEIVGLDVKVRPRQFFLTPRRTSQVLKLIVPSSHAEKLRDDNLIESINISVFCENGANANKEIIVKPSSLP